MNQQTYSPNDYKFIVAPTISGGLYAGEFRDTFYREHECLDEPNPELSLILSKHEQKNIGKAQSKILYFFQRTVMTSHGENILESAGASDELLHDDDPNVVWMYKVYKEFTTNNPMLDVITMLPIDMLGTFGFIVCYKDM